MSASVKQSPTVLDNVFQRLIAEGTFCYGVPKRVDEKTLTVVLPILRTVDDPRGYVTYPEALDKVLVFDTGKIDEMEIENQTEHYVYLRSGTLFRGATQERALQRSFVVFPGTRAKMSVRCVHQSKGINPQSKTTFGGITPLSFDQNVYGHGYEPKDQGKYWHEVRSYSTSSYKSMTGNTPLSANFSFGAGNVLRSMDMSSVDPGVTAHFSVSNFFKGDDLASSMDSFSKNFDEVLSKIKREETQCGLALITESGVQTVELFDHKDSWKALHEAAVKRMGAELVKQDVESVFEFKPEKARAMVNKVLALDWKRTKIFQHRAKGDFGLDITGLSADGYVGEAVELDDRLIHLVVLKKA